MRLSFVWIAAAMLALLSATPGLARDVLSLTSDMPVKHPADAAAILEDPDAVLTPADILDGDLDADFALVDGTAVGPTRSAVWVRLEAVNATKAPIDWVINLPNAQVDEADIYHVIDGAVVAVFTLGDKRPETNKVLTSDGNAAPLVTPPDATSIVYIRLYNRIGDVIDPYFEVSSPQAFVAKQQVIWLLFGLFIGGTGILFLYNTILFLRIRSSLYFWYIAYLGTVIAAVVAATGIGTRFLWSTDSSLPEATPPFLTSLALALVVQFSRAFLDTRRRAPHFDKFLRLAIAYFAIPPVAYLAGDGALALQLIAAGGLILTPLPVYGAWLWWRGHREARFFTVAWGAWFTGSTLAFGRVLGVLPSIDLTVRFFWVGVLMEAVLFAFALAERIRTLQTEKAAAERRERESLERMTAELEARVAERTEELSQKHGALTETIAQKDRLLSIVAHDLIGPFSIILGMTEVLKERAARMDPTKVAAFSADVHESAKALHKLLDNLLTWARMQRGELTFEPTEIDLSHRARQTIDLFRPIAAQKDVRIVYDGPTELPCRVDPNLVDTVLRNLVSNAIKFSHPDGTVTVDGAPRDDGGVLITVTDTGLGMTDDVQTSLFRLGAGASASGTVGETGTGIGLRLCYELLRDQGGGISVRSAPDEGAAFSVTFPPR
ncbi:sensor histidine kinase [Rhodospirillaceae bacterium KN72]|uniref:histidine kinase n=1 Tax=Pacificispira spongiicola TaxID=2729598 RepID=A0A7Y0E0U9_9PROT|nr:sensor histidine kinase [Pacificispira spongiicola]NMM45134.1 sensor histidine kinase [Pacificispira spongiicola]